MKAKIVGNNCKHLILDVIKVDGDLYYFDGFPSAIHKDDLLEIYSDGVEPQVKPRKKRRCDHPHAEKPKSDLFKNAKFGDRFRTPSGQLAIFIAKHKDHVVYMVQGELFDYAIYNCDYNGNGLCSGECSIASKDRPRTKENEPE